MAPTDLRPRSATEILDAAFQILKRDYASFLVLATAAYLPFVVAMIAIEAGSTPNADPDQIVIKNLAITIPLALVWLPIAETAVVLGASEVILGRTLDTTATLSRALSRFGPIVVAALIKGVLTIVGAVFLIVPGVIAWLGLFATPAVCVLEDLPAVDSIGRSWRLAKGHKGKVFGVVFLAYLILSIVQGFVSVVGTILGLSSNISSIAATVLSIFIYPLIGISIALLYYDARIRKEGFDLEVMAQRPASASA